jgi:hypothetical protein
MTPLSKHVFDFGARAHDTIVDVIHRTEADNAHNHDFLLFWREHTIALLWLQRVYPCGIRECCDSYTTAYYYAAQTGEIKALNRVCSGVCPVPGNQSDDHAGTLWYANCCGYFSGLFFGHA